MVESMEADSAKPVTGLFKYFTPDKLTFFENRLVLLTPPKYLNDPWDFLPKGRILTDEEIVREWQKWEKENAECPGKSMPAEFAQLPPKERLRIMLASGKSREFYEGLPDYSRECVSLKYGIVSLTEKSSCRLMWAHYATSHSGFVAEFSVTGHFERPEENLACCCCMGLQTCKVKYPLAFKPSPWTRDNIFIESMSKHPLWKYEQEWRILFRLGDKLVRRCVVIAEKTSSVRYCLPFLPEHLTRVVFGMQMKPEDQQRIHIMLNHDGFKHVQKQIADIDNETGELILKPLS